MEGEGDIPNYAPQSSGALDPWFLQEPRDLGCGGLSLVPMLGIGMFAGGSASQNERQSRKTIAQGELGHQGGIAHISVAPGGWARR